MTRHSKTDCPAHITSIPDAAISAAIKVVFVSALVDCVVGVITAAVLALVVPPVVAAVCDEVRAVWLPAADDPLCAAPVLAVVVCDVLAIVLACFWLVALNPVITRMISAINTYCRVRGICRKNVLGLVKTAVIWPIMPPDDVLPVSQRAIGLAGACAAIINLGSGFSSLPPSIVRGCSGNVQRILYCV